MLGGAFRGRAENGVLRKEGEAVFSGTETREVRENETEKRRWTTQESFVGMRWSSGQQGQETEKREFIVVTTSVSFSACRPGSSTLFCSFLTILVDSYLLTRRCYLPSPVLLIYFLGHLGLAKGLERNHVTAWLEADSGVRGDLEFDSKYPTISAMQRCSKMTSSDYLARALEQISLGHSPVSPLASCVTLVTD